jgi:hypothetical protein
MTDSTRTEAGLRNCPTRVDGTPVRIAQRIQAPQCQDRQRALYHKCFTCEHANGRELNGHVEPPARTNGHAVNGYALNGPAANGHAHA